jgi:hypothetical protein
MFFLAAPLRSLNGEGCALSLRCQYLNFFSSGASTFAQVKQDYQYAAGG